MTKLFLIGTNHMDTDGDVKLLKLLNELNPDLISVESNPAKADALIASYENFQRHAYDPEKRKIAMQKFEERHWNSETAQYFLLNGPRWGYEILIPQFHFRSKGVKLGLTDLVVQAEEMEATIIGETGELSETAYDAAMKLPLEEIRKAVEIDSKVENFEDLYRDAMRELGGTWELHKDDPLFTDTYRRFVDANLPRDLHAEQRIRTLQRELRPEVHVQISGTAHVAYTYTFNTPNLADRLADLQPEVIRLDRLVA